MGKTLSNLAVFIFSVTVVQADLGEIVRKGDPGTESLCHGIALGQVCRMNHFEAGAYCQSQNTRLPTARELAFDVQQNHGAVGFCERGSSWSYSVRTWETTASQSNGQSDYFYFNSTGYQRPSGDLGNNFFWSSSLLNEHSDYAEGCCTYWAWVLNGVNGYLDSLWGYRDEDYEEDWDYNAVRCVRSP